MRMFKIPDVDLLEQIYEGATVRLAPNDEKSATVAFNTGVAHDSWSLSHLGYLYPGTTPVMIKLDHNRSCPWV